MILEEFRARSGGGFVSWWSARGALKELEDRKLRALANIRSGRGVSTDYRSLVQARVAASKTIDLCVVRHFIANGCGFERLNDANLGDLKKGYDVCVRCRTRRICGHFLHAMPSRSSSWCWQPVWIEK